MQSGIDILGIASKLPSTSLPTRAGPGATVLFVHNGEAIIGGCDVGKIRLWQCETGSRLQTLEYSSKSTLTSYASQTDDVSLRKRR